MLKSNSKTYEDIKFPVKVNTWANIKKQYYSNYYLSLHILSIGFKRQMQYIYIFVASITEKGKWSYISFGLRLNLR